ncbi:MAG: D-alanyl-D-alanine carboxypeptidase [Gemmatimonadales bacterium]|nr:MAG: D-alanyl-D-alanine carboxypeptidase [Gemmatimonadales bacterium]
MVLMRFANHPIAPRCTFRRRMLAVAAYCYIYRTVHSLLKVLNSRALVVLYLAFSLVGPASASGIVRPDDSVGGIPASARAAGEAPDVSMRAGFLSAPDGRELWSRSADEPRAMASTTKIMTAVVTLEHAELDEDVKIEERTARAGESYADLRAGETYTVKELLEALIVPSGNDAARALATHVGGTEQGFVAMMNEKAQELGLSETEFSNSHGLDAAGHHTSPRDLATLSDYAMKNPEFRRIAGLKKTTIDGGNGPRTLESRNALLGEVVGATGIKTGWTSDAGFCIVGSATRHDSELIAVVLGASSEAERFSQSTELLEWGFEHYGRQEFASADETMGAVPVADYLDRDVGAVLEGVASAGVFDLDGDISEDITLPSSVQAPVEVGQRLGTYTVRQGDRLLTQVPIVAAEAISKPGIAERIWISIVRGWRRATGWEPAATAP